MILFIFYQKLNEYVLYGYKVYLERIGIKDKNEVLDVMFLKVFSLGVRV